MVEIRDIKPLVNIPDYSPIYLAVVSILCILVTIFISTKIYKYIKNKNKKSNKQKYLEILKSVDLSNAKESAYIITKYARKLALDNRSIEIFEALYESLEKYKYKKNVDNLDEDSIKYLHLFIDVAKDVQMN